MLLDIMRDAHLQLTNFDAAVSDRVHKKLMEEDIRTSLTEKALDGWDTYLEKSKDAGKYELSPLLD